MNVKNIKSVIKPYSKNIKEVLKSAYEVEDIFEMARYYKWENHETVDETPYLDYRYKEDLNKRRLRDAETLVTTVLNSNAKTILEIGTAEGGTTNLIASMAPQAMIHTMNIPPEEIHSGEGGKKVTHAYTESEIGRVYKQNNRKNVRQILSNSATWVPDIKDIDVAFIDGCHDADFVYNDTKKILPLMKPGGYILWHDFNPNLIHKHSWIQDVCMGIDRLLKEKRLKRDILFVRNSWVGVYKIPSS